MVNTIPTRPLLPPKALHIESRPNPFSFSSCSETEATELLTDDGWDWVWHFSNLPLRPLPIIVAVF